MHLPRRWLRQLAAFLLTIALITSPLVSHATEAVESLLQQSRQRYEAGQLDAAKTLLQQAQAQADGLNRAIAISNLALIESEQGNWEAANRLILESFQTLQPIGNTAQKQPYLPKC